MHAADLHGGQDLRPRPLATRRNVLEAQVIEQGYQGLVAKDPASNYLGGRTLKWLKVKQPRYRTWAGPKEDVAAATQAWVDDMNNHDSERVVVLYDPEAVLWGTRSPTLRDNPATVRDYFKILGTVPASYRVVIGEQRIRVYGDIAINTGTYTFSQRSATTTQSAVRRGSALSTGIAMGAG